MKRIIPFIIVLLTTNIVLSQNIRLKSGKSSSSSYYTSISYTEVNSKIIIPVTINNKKYRFLFDTGAPNLISKELRDELNLNNSNDIGVKDANNNKQRLEVVTLPSLMLGDVAFKEATALVFGLRESFVFNCLNVDGIIGSNLVYKSVVKISSKDKQLILTNNIRRINPSKDHQSKLTLIGDQSSPYITIKLLGDKNGSEQVLFDTGMNGLYDMTIRHFNLFNEENILTSVDEGQGSSSIGLFGNSDNKNLYRAIIPTLKINNASFSNVSIETTHDTNSRIGAKLLEYGNVILDFRKKKFYFEPFKEARDLKESHFGFAPTIIDDKIVIGTIWDEGLKDMTFGDEILKINDVDLEKINPCDLINNASILESSEKIHLTYKNSKGEKKSITLYKKPL